VISAVSRAQNLLNIVTNQITMYAQAPADSTGWRGTSILGASTA